MCQFVVKKGIEHIRPCFSQDSKSAIQSNSLHSADSKGLRIGSFQTLRRHFNYGRIKPYL